MTQLAGALKTLSDNGRERKSDGLWKHLGQIDGGTLRAFNSLAPRAGQGVEVFNIPGSGPTQGVLMSYDRDLDTFRDLTITARNVLIAANAGGNLTLSPAGSLVLPNGSITTAMLATGAAQALIGSYLAAPNAAASTPSVWQETIISSGTISCSGVLCRIEVTVNWTSLTAQSAYWGLMLDHAQLMPSLALTYCAAGVYATSTFMFYTTPSAGPHVFSVMVFPGAALTIHGNAYSSLYVTEQKR